MTEASTPPNAPEELIGPKAITTRKAGVWLLQNPSTNQGTSLRPGVSLLSSELAVHAQLDRARTSRAITSLVSKKLVLRQLVPHDQRKATVTLTDKGREMYESFFPVVVQLNQFLLDGLDESVINQLDQALSHAQVQADQLKDKAGQAKANRGRRTVKK